MKTALDTANHIVTAAPDALQTARCPHCGAPVSLRRRQRGPRPEDVSYFWRHKDKAGSNCPARLLPLKLEHKGL